MSNTVKCQDCPTVLTRGRMHVRSRSFEQAFICPACMVWRERLAELVRAVHEGVAA